MFKLKYFDLKILYCNDCFFISLYNKIKDKEIISIILSYDKFIEFFKVLLHFKYKTGYSFLCPLDSTTERNTISLEYNNNSDIFIMSICKEAIFKNTVIYNDYITEDILEEIINHCNNLIEEYETEQCRKN